jgi:hypothetical protein
VAIGGRRSLPRPRGELRRRRLEVRPGGVRAAVPLRKDGVAGAQGCVEVGLAPAAAIVVARVSMTAGSEHRVCCHTCSASSAAVSRFAVPAVELDAGPQHDIGERRGGPAHRKVAATRALGSRRRLPGRVPIDGTAPG